jgi:hypothetical protein
MSKHIKSDIPMEFLVNETALAIFACQHLVVCIRDHSPNALENVVSHGVEVFRMILMIILAYPNSGLHIRRDFRETSYVNVQAISDVNPARVNDIFAIPRSSLPGPRIYIEKILSRHSTIRRDIVMHGAIEVICHVFKSRAGNLGV